MSFQKNLNNVVVTLTVAFAVALGMHVFVYPTDFAPSGVDGLAAMLQKLTGINAGIFTFAINIPLLAVAWFLLKRRYVIYTILYTVALSLFLYLLSRFNFYQYSGEGEKLIPALFGGVAQGLTGFMLRMGASSGGVDVMGCMIQRKIPHKDLERVISFISISIVGISFLVYRNLGSVLLSSIEIYVCERVTAAILRDSRQAVKFEVITEEADALSNEILREMRHGATILRGNGLYTGREKQIIFCVVNYRDIPEFLKIMVKHPDAFLYYSDVMGVRGRFEGRPER